MKMLYEVIEGLPLQYQKENNIKFYKSFEAVIEYLNTLIEELKGQTSLYKTKGIFLDFMGERYKEKRNRRDDEEYRKALVSKQMAVAGLPTTEFLLDIARQLSGAEIIDLQTRYKKEVASQYFRANLKQDFTKINKFPNLNIICEAGARMYWDLELSKENLIFSFGSIINTGKNITIFTDFSIDQTLRIRDQFRFGSAVGIARIINVGG